MRRIVGAGCVGVAALTAAVVFAFAALSPAFAHGFLSASDPAENAVLDGAPASVRLKFSEPVEVGASIFKVYPLPAGEGTDLKGAAGALVSEVLRARGDEEQRADAGVSAAASVSQEVEILLKEGLAPGAYVVMWRVLSVDTHVTEGFFVFQVQPGGGDV